MKYKLTLLVCALWVLVSSGGVATSQVIQPSDSIPTIDGRVNPELIPNEAAYSMFFRVIASGCGSGATDLERQRTFSYIGLIGLQPAEGEALLNFVCDFGNRVAPTDQEAASLKQLHWPQPRTDIRNRMLQLQIAKDAAVSETISSLATVLGPDAVIKVRNFVTGRVKSRMKYKPLATVIQPPQ